MRKYTDLIFTKVKILQFPKRKKMIFIDSIINSTFRFDGGLYSDWDLPDISNDQYTDNQNYSEHDWGNSKSGFTTKKHLLREERDPNLFESRLDFDFINTKPSLETKCLTKGEEKLCEHDASTEEETKLYTDRILKPDRDGDNLLFIAIISNKTHLSILLIDLISHYSRLKVFNKLFQTALHLAALTENAKIARRLVIAGIDVEFRDRFGNTALHIACRQGFTDVVESLVTAVTYKETQLNSYTIPYQPIPQNLDIRNSEGLTCLHLAVIHKYEKVVSLLLSKEANVDVIEMKAGKTCLHFAAESGSDKIVEIILSRSRPKLSAKTFTGYTATDLAHYRGHDRVVYLLRCKGASAARPIETIETTELEDDIMEYSTVDIDDYEEDNLSDIDYESEDDDCIILEG
ncbi:NF-kappa-B inhibitor alpha-like [Ruditapes philippinarum]|uniref:NF-kappa-B inhibitor alpha-like n=1 Tax=Ruditapes philippinarum TaxID=129788 RepID=UPI00295A84CC|nr:NF-kappa-B inhibitor alpha-like [Ruditapes philippinarum]